MSGVAAKSFFSKVLSSALLMICTVATVQANPIIRTFSDTDDVFSAPIYSESGEQTRIVNMQSVYAGVVISTNPADWELTAEAFNWDTLEVLSAVFWWQAMPTTLDYSYSAGQIYRPFRDVQADGMPSAISLWSYYNLIQPGGDFSMSGPVQAEWSFAGTRCSASPIPGTSDICTSSIFGVTLASASVGVTINDLVIPAYSASPAFLGRDHYVTTALSEFVHPSYAFPNVPRLDPTASVPEPGSLALLGLGLAGLGFARRRKLN